jgi:rod shape-determining protein MreC
MAFGVSANRSLASRGPSPGFRFTLYAIISVTLMFLDQRGQWLEEVRYLLQGAAYPIQLAVSSPSTAWRWMQESAQTRDSLRAENEQLRARARDLEMRTLRYDALARENAELRGLREALPPVADRWVVAEIMNIQPNSLRQSVLVNRGTRNGVFESQAVLDDEGVLGQTTHVGPWSSEVILITDPEHAIPVQIERTGVRTIAVGSGSGLALPFLPGNADVKAGDLLITSGLGGVFPQGYPVGRIAAVQREAVQPLAQVRATPTARIDQAREVMLVWFRAEHPAAPGTTTGEDLKVGDARMQPQPAPPKPKPAPATPSPPADSSTSAKPAATTSAAGSAPTRANTDASRTPPQSAPASAEPLSAPNSAARTSTAPSSPAGGADRGAAVTPAPSSAENTSASSPQEVER